MVLDLSPTFRAQLRAPHSDQIPPPVLGSPLMQRGGFDVFEGLLDDPGRAALLSEAAGLRPGALESRLDHSENQEGRGGSPARKFISSPGGPVQDAFYHAPWMLAFLQDVTGLNVQPTGERGTYTFYTRAGDYLALHRDVESCDLAVITCLHDTPAGGPHGALRLYPGHAAQPLSAIRADPLAGAVDVRLLPGQTITLLGGIVPHAVLPMADRQRRIVSVLCYQVLV